MMSEAELESWNAVDVIRKYERIVFLDEVNKHVEDNITEELDESDFFDLTI